MPSPTNSPLISSVPLKGASFILGEVTNQYQPTKVSTYNVVIPGVLVGNEAKAGYSAFTVDGLSVTRGSTGLTAANFVGFFASYNYAEGDAGSNPYSVTQGDNFTVPVCQAGSVYVHNCTVVSSSVASGLKVVLVSSNQVTYPVGSVFQGTDPVPVTSSLDISSAVKVIAPSSVVGAGVLVSVLQK
jgi:hypothetical protein